MKSNNLMEIMGNISDENLMRAEKYVRAQRSRKIFTKIAAVAACLCIVTGTVLGYSIMSKKKTPLPQVSDNFEETPNKYEYVIYGVTSSDSIKADISLAQQNNPKSKYIAIAGDISTINLSPTSTISIKKPSQEIQTTISYLGTEHTVTLIEEHTIAYSSSYEDSVDFGIYLKYAEKITDQYGNYYLNLYTIRKSDQKVLAYYSNSKELREATGSLTSEQLGIIAQNWLLSFLQDEDTYSYQLAGMFFSGGNNYKFLFRRNIYSYASSDYITVTLNSNGDILSFNAETYEIFAPSVSDTNENDIDNVFEALNEIYSNDSFVINKNSAMIHMDQNGDLYVFVTITNKKTQKLHTELYVKINRD